LKKDSNTVLVDVDQLTDFAVAESFDIGEPREFPISFHELAEQLLQLAKTLRPIEPVAVRL
jgi:hypothetical protein